ncbi:MAG: hypothetical protein Hyperionvirus34_12 [Hyperionvirus sp.]|uniref:phenylalanine--tRNA ligase n=1 Tax=Hyperionvirus sp. TaxID=2487770 RepID=A0A3G5ABR5_9VIRU|nr:MAG: hypothetical protein Hyperionvirus34_12 [Hyperionvirus sp.]
MKKIEELEHLPKLIRSKFNAKLHKKENHPICIVKNTMMSYFQSAFNAENVAPTTAAAGASEHFVIFDDINPVVSTKNNFDLLLIAPDHPSRSKSDTYYVTEETVLRTHTSAHQNELLALGHRSFIVTGDVYRKDQVDKFHFPIFHQMEGVKIIPGSDIKIAELELKKVLAGMASKLFPGKESRFNPDYFPFTEPSFELEVKFGEKWVEVLGCGVIHREILDRHGIKDNGFAFGIGLERIAMILFAIPDIRMFWTDDLRFLSQFKNGEFKEFKQYRILEPLDRDITMWLATADVVKSPTTDDFKWTKLNDFYELVREICGENVENVELRERYHNKKADKYSHCFRIKFSPNVAENNPAEFKKIADAHVVQLQGKIFATLGAEPR